MADTRAAGRRRAWAGLLGTFLVLPAGLANAAEDKPKVGRKVLLIMDPTDGTRPTQLLEAALTDHLSQAGQVVYWPGRDGSRTARTQKLLKQANILRKSGRRAFETLELDTALRHYEKALEKLERSIVATSTLVPLYDTLSKLAASHLLMGQKDEAREYLLRLLSMDPDYEPDTSVYNPEMIRAFEDVQGEVRGRKEFEISIRSIPEGASLFLDGRFAGLAPIRTKVKPGRHVIRATKGKYENSTRAMSITRNDRITLSLPRSRRSKLLTLAQSAADNIEDLPIPNAATSLGEAVSAEDIVVVAALDDGYLLVRFDVANRGRNERTTAIDVGTIDDAKRAAAELISWIPRPGHSAAPEPTEEEGGTNPTTTPTSTASNDPAPSPTVIRKRGLFSDIPVKNKTLWGTYGASVGLGFAGFVVGMLALKSSNDFSSGSTTQVDGQSIADAGRTRALVSDVFFGFAGAMLLTSVGLHIFWNPETDERSTSLRLGPSPEAHAKTPGLRLQLSPGGLRLNF